MRITEEFSLDGHDFVYIDFSKINMKDEFASTIEETKSVIAAYPPNSLYTITHIASVMYDSELKEVFAEYMTHNRQYVKYGVVIGLDGIKKIIANTIFKISGRTNMYFAFSKEQAIEWLLKRE